MNFVEDLKKSHLLNKLTDHHRFLYDTIDKHKEILSGKLWDLYLKECRMKKIKPMGLRTYSLYVNKLRDLGLTEVKRVLVKEKVKLLRVVDY